MDAFARWFIDEMAVLAMLAVIALPLGLRADPPPATAPAAIAPANAYLPLTPGTTWQYNVQFTLNGAASRPVFQTITVGQPIQAHLPKNEQCPDQPHATLIPVGSDLYQLRPDGIYYCAKVQCATGDNSAATGPSPTVVPLDMPEKIIPATLKPDEKWNWIGGSKDDPRSTYCTCSAEQSITTAAGKFDAMCVVSTTSNEDDTDRREVSRYFAPGVGIVRETVQETCPGADGKIETRQTTRELQKYSIAAPALQPAAHAAEPVSGSNSGRSNASPAATDAAGISAASLFEEGKALAKDHQHEQALAKYAQSLRIDGRQAEVYAYAAVSHLALQRHDRAWEAIQKAIGLNDRQASYWEIAGQIKASQSKAAEARPLYDKAAGLAPQDAGVIYTDFAATLAAAHEDSLAGAIQGALEAAASANPPGAEALFQLGQSYANAGRPEAKKYLQRYIEVESKLPLERRDAEKIRLSRQLIGAMDALEQ